MQIGDIITWNIPAVYNGVGLASSTATTGTGKIEKIGRKYITVATSITVGCNSYPTTTTVEKSSIIEIE